MIRLFKSKKGMLFNVLIVIFTVVVLTYAYIQISEKLGNVKKEIGESQLEVITKIQEGEKALIFLDFAAKLALYQAAYDLQASGGISESSACGTYYGFNRWNSDSGSQCFVDSNTAKDSLRNLFTSNLVARVAAYPTADFVGNVQTAAFTRGQSISGEITTASAAGASTSASTVKCTVGQEFTRDFTYTSESGFFPKDGGRVWVPSEASCAGSYPLIVFLHGCMTKTAAKSHTYFGDNSAYDIIPIAKSLVNSGKVTPFIMAAPSQTLGTATFNNVENSPCGESLWGNYFNPSEFVNLVKSNLPAGVSISSVSFVGHSGAGCHTSSGIHRALKDVSGIFAIGQFDTCAGSVYGNSLNSRLGSETRFMAVYSTMGSKRAEQNSAMKITKEVSCPSSSISGGTMKECYSDDKGNYLAYAMQENNHNKAASLGIEQFLAAFFPARAAKSAAV
jgi:hypothetical protein